MDSPQEFITTDANNKPVLIKKTAELLADVEQPITVVAIVGKYRTGKSYLLNRLIGKSGGFPLGSTVQSKTKGIWMWLRPHPTEPNRHLLLIDTEGLADPEKASPSHDIWIFSLAILLSSTFVYNSVGTIDNTALNDLHLASTLTENLMVKAGGEEDGTEFGRFFPIFVWVVRDFFLEKEIEGKAVSANEYLEHCLVLKKGRTKAISDANHLKQCIRSFFEDRHCFVLPRPVNEEEKLRHLETVRETDLDPKFMEVSREFTEFIYRKAPAKKVRGKEVNGRMFVNMAQCYVDAIREGKIPCIESAVSYVSKVENTKAIDNALGVYDSDMTGLRFPTDEANLHQQHMAAQTKAMKAFATLSVLDKSQEYQTTLTDMLRKRYVDLVAKNEASSVSKCRAILQELSKDIEQQVKNGAFLKPGGYELYRSQMERLERAYMETKGKGFKANDVFNEFMREKEVERAQILNADTKLKEEERKMEQQRSATLKANREKQALQKNLEWTIMQNENMKIQHEEAMRKQKEIFEAKMKEECCQLEQTMKNQMIERERTLREGFAEQSETLMETVRDLQFTVKGKQGEIDSMKSQFNETLERQKRDMDAKLNEALEKERKDFNARLEADKLASKQMEQMRLDMEKARLDMQKSASASEQRHTQEMREIQEKHTQEMKELAEKCKPPPPEPKWKSLALFLPRLLTGK